jgi:hypothetical protein
MRQLVILTLLWVVAACPSIAAADRENSAKGLKPDEYSAAALIYNNELSVLGSRALYPICVTASGVPDKPLIRYLQQHLDQPEYQVSEFSLCVPRQPHPKNYPHGLVIDIGQPQRESERMLNIHVHAGDATLHVGVHFATLLREGTYHLKRDDKGEWQIVGYTKKYNFADEEHPSGDCGGPASEPKLQSGRQQLSAW